MRIAIDTYLPQSPEWVWERVKKSATLEHIAAPLIRFGPAAGRFPDTWAQGEYDATMRLFGFLPIGRQTIGIEYPDNEAMVLRDNGRGTMIAKWDHWIFITGEQGGTRYRDRVDIEAGWLTPFIAAFARVFYAHRQRRWRRMAEKALRT